MCCAASGGVTELWSCVQEEVLSGKAKAQANVEELERLIPLLKEVRRACATLVINAISLAFCIRNQVPASVLVQGGSAAVLCSLSAHQNLGATLLGAMFLYDLGC